MRFKVLFSFIALLICGAAHAQTNYTIERDSAGFVMIQGGQATPFDTTTVRANIAQKEHQAAVIETEIQLLERLVLLRRQAAIVKEERNTLLDILEKARKCGNH